MIVIDAKGCIAGRIAAHAAKYALLGQQVEIVNAEEAFISGPARRTITEAKHKKFVKGVPRKGPFFSRLPDRYLRRIIRGMLPYKQPRGREAYARVKCHVGVPDAFKEAKPVVLAHAEKRPAQRITIGALCKELGGKHG